MFKKLRFAIFCIFHFLVYELQIVFVLKERDEFMKKYHKNDLACG